MRTERDIINQIEYAREKGMEEGRQEGRELGREEGRELGREEGRKEGLLQVVRAMLKQGIDKEFIVNCTGLSTEEVDALS